MQSAGLSFRAHVAGLFIPDTWYVLPGTWYLFAQLHSMKGMYRHRETPYEYWRAAYVWLHAKKQTPSSMPQN